VGGARIGASHAIPDDGSWKSLCGKFQDNGSYPIDGGYETVKENGGHIDCKLCQKVYNKLTSS